MTYELTTFLDLHKPVKGSGEQFDSDIYSADLEAIDVFAALVAGQITTLQGQVGAVTAEQITNSTSLGRTILKAASVAAVLNALGVSAFIQTLLDDAAASNARTTLGAGTKGATIFTAADLAAARSALEISYGTAAANNGDGMPDGHIYIKHSA